MKTPLAWRNVWQNKARSLVALCGISFAILLIFMQLGFYAASGRTATLVFDALDFDVLVRSPQYVFVAHPAGFPRNRLEEIRASPGVVSVESGLGRSRRMAEPRNPPALERADARR